MKKKNTMEILQKLDWGWCGGNFPNNKKERNVETKSTTLKSLKSIDSPIL
jgi:hypothetical protein